MLSILKPPQRTPVIVVLGGGIKDDGSPSPETLLRSQAAAALALKLPTSKIILSGKGPSGVWRPKTEAQVMSALLADQGIDKSRLLLEDESVDTAGNAVLVSAKFLTGMQPADLYLVTSPFHMNRALLVFRKTLNPGWTIKAHSALPAPNDRERARNELGGVDWTKKFFHGLTPGCLHEIIEHLQSVKPYYAGISWLIPSRYKPSLGKRLWWRLRNLNNV
jgi:hypothetical protein